MLSKGDFIIKRIFDLGLTLLCLPLILPLIILLYFLATLSLGKTGLFRQQRVGQDGRLFILYKIRTLKGINHEGIAAIKENESRFGKWLRKSKLDELPQLFNILIGNMSWVGPRPDVPGYADTLLDEDRIILTVKPGLTGPATLKYKDEDELLLQQFDSQKFNDTVIWPDKVAINKLYVENWSFWKDVGYLWKSVSGGI